MNLLWCEYCSPTMHYKMKRGTDDPGKVEITMQSLNLLQLKVTVWDEATISSEEFKPLHDCD